jgi:hypothetical protein
LRYAAYFANRVAVEFTPRNADVVQGFFITTMESEDRKKARRERRIAARKHKREECLKPYNDFSLVVDIDNLNEAFKHSKRGVAWKESVQRYEANAMRNITAMSRDLLAGNNIQHGFVEFDLRERGKVRHIKSIHISERIVQKCLCDKCLVPILSYPLIHDNGASIKNKGVHFALRRLITHLRRFYRGNDFSNEGYVLLVDFTKFFDNIRHELLFSLQKEYITDQRLRDLTRAFIRVFGDGISLGLGSQVSQISAIFMPNKLDHYIKDVLRIKGYGRYMDDLYLIHADKKYLEECLVKIKAVCKRLSIIVNERKTRIVKLSAGVPFLKGKYTLLPSGKILRILGKDSVKRMRRKLVKFKALLNDKKMDYKDIFTAYQSWRGGYMKRFNAHFQIKRMDALYNTLFIAIH